MGMVSALPLVKSSTNDLRRANWAKCDTHAAVRCEKYTLISSALQLLGPLSATCANGKRKRMQRHSAKNWNAPGNLPRALFGSWRNKVAVLPRSTPQLLQMLQQIRRQSLRPQPHVWGLSVPQITEVAQFIYQKKSNDALRLLQILGKYKYA